MVGMIYKNKKKIIIGVALVLVLIIGAVIYYAVWNGIYSATMNIMVAPSIAKVKVDGREHGVMEEFRVKPGEYTAEISAEGFVTKSVTVTATAGETANIFEYLEPVEGNENWYAEHGEDGAMIGDIMYLQFGEANEKLAEKNPIMRVLPMKVEYYTANYARYIRYDLNYEGGEDEKITIFINDFSGGNEELAKERLNSLGYDLSEYEIKYNDRTSEYLGD